MFLKGPRNRVEYLAAISGSFSVLSSGINLSWTSPYLPQLLDPASEIPTTSEQGLWCAVMALVGAPVGAIFAAIYTDRIGRKTTTLVMAPVVVLSLIMIAFAKSVIIISIARFLIGAVEGGLYTVMPIYIAEISSPNIRGLLTATIDVATIIGTLFINAIGPYTTIFESSMICTLVPILHFFSFIFMPESPYFLIKKEKFEDAKQALRSLRGTKDIDQEYNDLCEAVKRQESGSKSSLKHIFTEPGNRRAAYIFMILSTTNKFSGNNPILFYATIIFTLAQTNISPTLSVIIYCTVRLFSLLFAITIVDKFGRRPMLMTSAFGCSIFIFLEGLYFFLKTYQPEVVSNLNWLPIVALVGYVVLFSVGLSSGPVVLIGELFPTSVKAVSLCLGDTFSVVMGTIASKYFQVTMDQIDLFVPFWSFSVCCLIGLYFIYKFLPETKGKTLEEIQLTLLKKL